MAATTLNNQLRESIARDLLHHAFKKRAQEMVERCALFACKVYDDSMKRHLQLINTLPSGWLPVGSSLRVEFAGQMAGLYFGGSFDSNSVCREFRRAGAKEIRPSGTSLSSFHTPVRPFPNKYHSQCLKQYSAKDALSIEFFELERDVKDLRNEISAAEQSALKVLESVRSIEKLLKVWPEVEPFARPYLKNGERKALLPAVRFDELNAQLGIAAKVKETEAA